MGMKLVYRAGCNLTLWNGTTYVRADPHETEIRVHPRPLPGAREIVGYLHQPHPSRGVGHAQLSGGGLLHLLRHPACKNEDYIEHEKRHVHPSSVRTKL